MLWQLWGPRPGTPNPKPQLELSRPSAMGRGNGSELGEVELVSVGCITVV